MHIARWSTRWPPLVEGYIIARPPDAKHVLRVDWQESAVEECEFHLTFEHASLNAVKPTNTDDCVPQFAHLNVVESTRHFVLIRSAD